MTRIYLFPKVFPSENPYVINLEKSLSGYYDIVNKKSNPSGVLDLYKYLFKTDIYYFNWIENLPSRRFGKLQVLIFFLFLVFAKCMRKKIIWTLHNKYSHDSGNDGWVDFMYGLMFRSSDFILTHSQSGVDFVREKYPNYQMKVKYFIHPVSRIFHSVYCKEPIYDFFIWGTIWFYKGVIEFLKFLKESGNNKYKVLVAGKCIDNNVKTELDRYLSSNIIYLNEFYDIDAIAVFANQSRFTLFTYKPESVLSSGSLMDSIGMGSVIIGPNTGAFKDLNNTNFVKTYESFDEILSIHQSYTYDRASSYEEISKFCNDNNWDLFGAKLNEAISLYLKL